MFLTLKFHVLIFTAYLTLQQFSFPYLNTFLHFFVEMHNNSCFLMNVPLNFDIVGQLCREALSAWHDAFDRDHSSLG